MMLGRQKQLIAVGILFLALTWITVSLRVYTRVFLLRKWGHDDSAMAVTLVLFTFSVAVQMLSVAHGVGLHRSDISPEDATTALIYFYLSEIFYVLAEAALKVALGLFYLRIAIERWQILLIKFATIGAATFHMVYFMLVVFQCSPVSSFWLIYPANHQCIPVRAQNAFTFTFSALNALTDWILGTLPFFIVRSLNLSRQSKMEVACVLAFAAIGSTGTIVRMKYVKNLTNGPEFLTVTIDVSIWSTVEPGIGITAASIATLRPLFQALLWRLGFAPAPTFLTARQLQSPAGRPNEPYRLDWFEHSHRPALARMESSTNTIRSTKKWPQVGVRQLSV